MTYGPIISESPFARESIYLPSDPSQLLIRLKEILTDISLRLNQRQIGIYQISETLSGQQWPSVNPTTSLQPFRKIFIGITITGSGTTSIAHNIDTTTIGFVWTRIEGTAQSAGATLGIPLPQSAPDDVEITVDPTNINIIAATGTYNGYTATVTLEYIKNS